MWTPERDEILRRMWREGALLREIAAATGSSTNAARRRSESKRLGIHPKSTRKRSMNAKTKAALIEMHGDGLTVTEMARATGFSLSTVSEFLRKSGCPRVRYITAQDTIKIPQSVLDDREMRYRFAPRDLTAVLMGDPPVGLSALERR